MFILFDPQQKARIIMTVLSLPRPGNAANSSFCVRVKPRDLEQHNEGFMISSLPRVKDDLLQVSADLGLPCSLQHSTARKVLLWESGTQVLVLSLPVSHPGKSCITSESLMPLWVLLWTLANISSNFSLLSGFPPLALWFHWLKLGKVQDSLFGDLMVFATSAKLGITSSCYSSFGPLGRQLECFLINRASPWLSSK